MEISGQLHTIAITGEPKMTMYGMMVKGVSSMAIIEPDNDYDRNKNNGEGRQLHEEGDKD